MDVVAPHILPVPPDDRSRLAWVRGVYEVADGLHHNLWVMEEAGGGEGQGLGGGGGGDGNGHAVDIVEYEGGGEEYEVGGGGDGGEAGGEDEGGEAGGGPMLVELAEEVLPVIGPYHVLANMIMLVLQNISLHPLTVTNGFTHKQILYKLSAIQHYVQVNWQELFGNSERLLEIGEGGDSDHLQQGIHQPPPPPSASPPAIRPPNHRKSNRKRKLNEGNESGSIKTPSIDHESSLFKTAQPFGNPQQMCSLPLKGRFLKGKVLRIHNDTSFVFGLFSHKKASFGEVTETQELLCDVTNHSVCYPHKWDNFPIHSDILIQVLDVQHDLDHDRVRVRIRHRF